MIQFQLTTRGGLKEAKLDRVIATELRTRIDFRTEEGKLITFFLDPFEAISLSVQLLGVQSCRSLIAHSAEMAKLEQYLRISKERTKSE